MNKVNVVNKVNVCKRVTFTIYPYESKRSGERGERFHRSIFSSSGICLISPWSAAFIGAPHKPDRELYAGPIWCSGVRVCRCWGECTLTGVFSARTPRGKGPLSALVDCRETERLRTPSLCVSLVNSGVADNWQLTTGNCSYSLLIPCFCTLELQKPAFHAAFRVHEKKFPVIFPVIENLGFGAAH